MAVSPKMQGRGYHPPTIRWPTDISSQIPPLYAAELAPLHEESARYDEALNKQHAITIKQAIMRKI
ncbi:MAG: hypothetical protein WC058_10190 [Phycisphaeraceae bacterium]